MKNIGPAKLEYNGKPLGSITKFEMSIEKGDIIEEPLPALLDGAIQKYSEKFQAEIIKSLLIPSSALKQASYSTSYVTVAQSMAWLDRLIPCEHCQDRYLWSKALYVTFHGRVCDTCLDCCLERGITVRRIAGDSIAVCRKDRV